MPGCGGKWKFGSLNAWKFGFCGYRRFVQRLCPSPRRGVPFSVLRARSALPLPGRGAAPPTPLISESAKIPFVYLCGSSCSSCFPQNTPPLSIAPPVARLSRVPFFVLRSPFSVFRSPGRLSRPLSVQWFGGARRRRSVCWAGRWRRRVRGARAGRWPWPRSEGPVRAFPRR